MKIENIIKIVENTCQEFAYNFRKYKQKAIKKFKQKDTILSKALFVYEKFLGFVCDIIIMPCSEKKFTRPKAILAIFISPIWCL